MLFIKAGSNRTERLREGGPASLTRDAEALRALAAAAADRAADLAPAVAAAARDEQQNHAAWEGPGHDGTIN